MNTFFTAFHHLAKTPPPNWFTYIGENHSIKTNKEQSMQYTVIQTGSQIMYLKFDHSEVMKHYRQRAKKASDCDRIHPSQTIERAHREAFALENNDKILLIVYTKSHSIITTKEIRVTNEDDERRSSSDWAFTSKEMSILNLEPGDIINRWFTPLSWVKKPKQPRKHAQQNLPSTTTGGEFLDPTRGTWLFVRDQDMLEGRASDGIDGSVRIRTNKPPYGKYLDLPTEEPVTIKAVHEDTEITFDRTLNGNGGSFTIPIDKRRELGVSPGDAVRFYISTNSIIKAIKQENGEEITEEEQNETVEIGEEPMDSWSRTEDSDLSVTGGSNKTTNSTITAETNSTTTTANGTGENKDENGSTQPPEPSEEDTDTPVTTDPELQEVLLQSERQLEDWPIHIVASADDETTIGGESFSSNVHTQHVDEFGTGYCGKCLLTAAITHSDTYTSLLVEAIQNTDVVAENDEITLSLQEIADRM